MWLIGNSWEMGQLSTRTCILYIACPNKWSFGILLSWAAWVVCIVKMLSQIAIFLARLGRPPINSWASPYFVNAIYIRPGAGPSLHSSPKCSRPYQNIVVTSLSLSLLHEMQSESAPFFNTRMLPISVYSENAVPRPAFSACFRGFCCNRARTTNHCFSRLGVTVYHTSVNASRMIDLAS
jgi:hypothetical protein